MHNFHWSDSQWDKKEKGHKLLSVSTSDYNEVRRTKSKHSENLTKYMGG